MLYIDIHTHNREVEQDTIKVVNLNTDEANAYLPTENLFSIGIHPWQVESNFETELPVLSEYASNPKFISIGEIGLDKTTSMPFEKQIKVFTEQLKIAHYYNKPVIIHCVKAVSELLEIKKKDYKEDTWILHGFQGSYETAKQLTSHNIYLSFGKHLLSKDKTIEAFRKIDLSYVFFETDDSDIKISDLYKEAAIIRGVKPSIIWKQVTSNFNNIFPEFAI